MDDFEGEFEQIQNRLRGAISGREPEPPADLVRFIDTVPALHQKRRGIGFSLGRRGSLTRGLALTAAAVLVAAVATQAIVNVRSSRNPAAAQSWSWHAVTGPALRFVLGQTAGGYVAECGDVNSVGTCSSRDGVNWTAGLDPAVASVDGGDANVRPPQNVLKLGERYLATGPMAVNSTGLISSTDGIHWSIVHSPELDTALASMTRGQTTTLAALSDRFIFVAIDENAQKSMIFTSADGLTWAKSGALPELPISAMSVGSSGFYVAIDAQPARYWRTLDGATWSRVDAPEMPVDPRSLPGGGYAAAPFDETRAGVLRSDDGSTWRTDQWGLQGVVKSFVVFQGRVLAEVDASGSAADGDAPIWESLDSGATWHELQGPDGRALAGTVRAMGDLMMIYRGSGVSQYAVYVGFLDSRSIATAPPTTLPTPAPSSTSGPVPTLLPDALRSEWSWHRMDGTSFEGPVAVPGGWIATCSAPGTGDFADAALCSSRDGLNWSNPADPGMIQVQGTDFWPLEAASLNGVYLAYSLQHWIPFQGDGISALWRSTDGRTWSKLPDSTFDGLRLTAADNLAVFKGQFVTVATTADGKSASLIVSRDGLSWTRLSDMPAFPNGWSVTDFGILMDANTVGHDPAANWVSRDGVNWTHVNLPEKVTDLSGSAVRLADGTYIDIGWDFAYATNETLVTSADGVTWQALPSKPAGSFMGALRSIDGRLILNMSTGANNDGPYEIWQSSDGGKTWQSVPDPEGFPATGLLRGLAGGLMVQTTDNIPTWWLGNLTAK